MSRAAPLLGCAIGKAEGIACLRWNSGDMNNHNKSLADRRLVLRHQVRREGRLLFVEPPCFAECTIQNISEDGALLHLIALGPIPRLVLLWERKTGAIHECQVRWRKGRTVGLRFTDVWGRAARRAALEKGLASLRFAPAYASTLH